MIQTMCEGVRSRDDGTVGCSAHPPSGRALALGGDVHAFQKKGHSVQKYICLICLFSVCLSGTNVPVERIFSIMNNTWTDERNRMTPTSKALLVTRAGFDDTCPQFHSSRLSANKSILEQIHSSNKYV